MSQTKIFKNKIFCVFIFASLLSFISFYFFDEKVSAFFITEAAEPLRYWGREITNIGLAAHYFIFSALVYLFFKFIIKKTSFWKTWAAQFFISLISCGLVVHIIKILFGRLRPHKTEPNFDPAIFAPINFQWHWQSFPSGHSQTLFTVATMFAVAFPKQAKFFYIFAGVIALTRVMTRDHYLSDTIFGAMLGYCVTKLVLKYFEKKNGHQLLRS